MEENLQLQKYYLPSIEKMRLLLMMGAILYTCGLFPGLHDLGGIIFGFVFPALYIISGYVVLREIPDIDNVGDVEKRIIRAIKRTAICFVIMFAVYFAMSLFADKSGTLALVASKSFWFDFLVLNICSLPIGMTIWYVQALLYAYIIIYLIYKCRLLKFDIYIAALCLVVTILTGELSSVIGFNLFGRTYLGGNFLTRALPYILIGHFIQRKEEFIVTKFNSLNYIGIFLTGIILTIGEYCALAFTGNKVYVGHLFGMGIVAVAVCSFGFFVGEMEIKSVLLAGLTRYEMMIPFYVCTPIYYLLTVLIKLDDELLYYLGGYLGIITLLLSIVILYLYACVRFAAYLIIHRKDQSNDSEYII